MSNTKLRPGQTLGLYPQQQETWPGNLEVHVKQTVEWVNYQFERRKYRQQYILEKVNGFEKVICLFSDPMMAEHIKQLRKRLLQYGLQDKLVAEAFATIREVSYRTLGKRHYDEQVFGGWVIMNGLLAEMETGQGKTLTATLPACTAALAGIPVHVVTANDYLAKRDEEILRPLYQKMGLSSAPVIDGMEIEPRKVAYQCDIVHSTSQQVTFDYLRDRMEMGDEIGRLEIQFQHLTNQNLHKPSAFLLRGLCFTIIDEADSLLVDEAKTPLVISQIRQSEEQNQTYFDALYLATSLDNKNDYKVSKQYQEVTLTAVGKNKLAELVDTLDDYWQQRKRREIMVSLALKAKLLFIRDTHYLVRDNKLEIIDALTGRAMPDRSWEHGLHQLIEAKEGCDITGERDPLARIGYQTFFKRYLRLSGMSGTVAEVAGELNSVYGLKIVKIPTHQFSKRKMLQEKVFQNSTQKWLAFVQRVKKLHRSGRPILIGTTTVADSKKISVILTKTKLPHQVLNAQQDQQEADIISKAGQLNSITVATNMAGRGTDISLGQGVKEIGGLHVIAMTRNDARRIDRQLYGRCARQGDPGSAEGFMSLQDEKITTFYPPAMLKLISKLCTNNKPLPNWLGKIILTLPQKWTEYKHYKIRSMLIKQDKQQAKTLSFTGRME
ncbi:MAG: DEAD/DEAH box helicase [Methylococcales bacterium]|nr:DEAD/DEAH box helicase [Methylococcales bacterium]